MAIAFGTAGAIATGATSLAVPYPSTPGAGDLFVLAVVNKYPANGPTTPDGWTLIANGQKQGGSGPSSADSGQIFITVFYKIAVGSETGNETVTITSGNSAGGRMFRYTRGGTNWSLAATNGNDNTVGVTWNPTMAGDPGLTSGDIALAISGTNSDRIDFSAPTLTAASTTISAGTERAENKVGDGDDCTLYVAEFSVTAGTSTGTPVYTHTNSSFAADDPCGATVLLRLREVSGFYYLSGFAD